MTVRDHHVLRPRRGLIAPGAGLLLAAGAAAPALGQCVPAWSALNGGAQAGILGSDVFDEDGPGPMPPRLFAGGGYPIMFAGVFVNGIARWDGWAALPVEQGITTPIGSGGGIETMRTIASDSGAIPGGVYVGGHLTDAGGKPINNLARWDGFEWFDVGGGVTSQGFALVFDLREFDEDGPGPLPSSLFVGGQFTHASGVLADGLARWNGSSWSVVGGGITPWHPSVRPKAYALEVYDDDGPGSRQPAIYVAGSFKWAGGLLVNNIARWDGASWEALGVGIAGTPVESLCVFDEDGPGPGREALFVGGYYTYAGGLQVFGFARWDGVSWSAVPGWFGGGVSAQAVFDDDGPGPRKPALFIAGGFSQIAGQPAHDIARWDGQQWDAMASGVSGPITEVYTLSVYDEDGIGPNPGGLYVGGYFTFAGGLPVNHIARWGCPLPARCDANCNRSFHPVTGAHTLSIADFTCFQTRYLLQDPWADCNADQQLTIADFSCFQTKFVAGCP